MIYDKFTPFQKIKLKNENLYISGIEVWKNGICEKRKADLLISIHNELNKTIVSIPNNNLNIKEILEFDLTYTSKDRIYSTTIAQKSNIDNNAAYNAYKLNFPIGFDFVTRDYKNYEENEPYCMSIYMLNGIIKMISLSFENKPRLIEFYIDSSKYKKMSNNSDTISSLLEINIKNELKNLKVSSIFQKIKLFLNFNSIQIIILLWSFYQLYLFAKGISCNEKWSDCYTIADFILYAGLPVLLLYIYVKFFRNGN